MLKIAIENKQLESDIKNTKDKFQTYAFDKGQLSKKVDQLEEILEQEVAQKHALQRQITIIEATSPDPKIRRNTERQLNTKQEVELNPVVAVNPLENSLSFSVMNSSQLYVDEFSSVIQTKNPVIGLIEEQKDEFLQVPDIRNQIMAEIASDQKESNFGDYGSESNSEMSGSDISSVMNKSNLHAVATNGGK